MSLSREHLKVTVHHDAILSLSRYNCPSSDHYEASRSRTRSDILIGFGESNSDVHVFTGESHLAERCLCAAVKPSLFTRLYASGGIWPALNGGPR